MKNYLIGLLVGDGALHKRKNGAYAVWIDQHTKNIKIFRKAVSIFNSLKYKTYVYNVPDNKIRVLTYCKELFEQLKEIRENHVNFFEKLSASEKKKFIGGFFDAEGTVTDRLVVYNKNKKLLEAIKKFLEQMGIVCYIYKYGKVFGIQIYREDSIRIFLKEIKCIKTEIKTPLPR